MARMFGTDGVRGIANEKLNGELAFKLGQASAKVLTGAVHKARILIGMDTRISGDMLESALVAGICSAGAEADILGVIPTSAVAHLTRQYGADAGAMISASHNSFEYNGIKFFNGNGYKLADSIEDQIEELVKTGIGDGFAHRPDGGAQGAPEKCEGGICGVSRIHDQRAAGRAEDCFGLRQRLGIRHCAGSLFRKLGAEVFAYHYSPDGTNINDNCGSTHPKHLRLLVQEMGADVGLAFDGDADRMIAVDERGLPGRWG